MIILLNIMSGKCFSSGKLTNKGFKGFLYQTLLLKIDSISLHIIPIALDSFGVDLAKRSEDFLKCFLHPALLPTVSHIAVQLNMENKDLFLI